MGVSGISRAVGCVVAAALSAVVPLSSVTAARAATTITVPGMQPTIQAGINAASTGDTVLVSPGTYTENIDFDGKAITVTSSRGAATTIIDGGAVGPVATFSSGEQRTSVLKGFTLRNGTTSSDSAYTAGGVIIFGGSPSIINNVITGNTGCSAVGVAVEFSSALVKGNTISDNKETSCSGGDGGGIEVGGAGSAQIIGNVITGNQADYGGGVTLFAAGTPTLENNVIENNTANYEGGGMWVVGQSDADVVQNIVAENTAPAGAGMSILPPSGTRGPELTNDTVAGNNGTGLWVSGFDASMKIVNTLFVAPPADAAVACDTTYIRGAPTFITDDLFNGTSAAFSGPCLSGSKSAGDFAADPQFANAAAADYHLSSGSAAINAGTNSAPHLPTLDLDGNPRIHDGIVDLGVYEFQGAIAPGPVTNLHANRIKTSITVSWSQPASNGNSPITGYRITASPGRTQTVAATKLSITYIDTKHNVAYMFSVSAINAVGAGPPTSVTVPKS